MGSPNKFPMEIRVGGVALDLESSKCTRMRMLDENELMVLLQDRLQKNAAEVRRLLKTYQRSVAQS
jgi:hypothetical protein